MLSEAQPVFIGVPWQESILGLVLFIIHFNVHVVVQFYPWFNFYFPLFLGMVIYDNEFETKENKN